MACGRDPSDSVQCFLDHIETLMECEEGESAIVTQLLRTDHLKGFLYVLEHRPDLLPCGLKEQSRENDSIQCFIDYFGRLIKSEEDHQ